MFNLAINMYTSEIITTSMLLLLRNVAFDTIRAVDAVDGKNIAYLSRNIALSTLYFFSDKHLILNTFKTFERFERPVVNPLFNWMHFCTEHASTE